MSYSFKVYKDLDFGQDFQNIFPIHKFRNKSQMDFIFKEIFFDENNLFQRRVGEKNS